MLPLLGKDNSFYLLLEKQAAFACAAAQVFQDLCQDLTCADKYAAQAEQIESQADEITHQLANKIDSTFVTPLDKEDLYALSTALDDVTDQIEAAIARVAIYRLVDLRPELKELVDLLRQITLATSEAVVGFRDLHGRDTIHPNLLRIHEIENASDKAFRNALRRLFNAPDPDPLMVIKWKEIFDRIEAATDTCENVADVIESVVMKYA